MNGRTGRKEALQRVKRHALAAAAAEYSLADDPKAAAVLVREEAATELAARDLTRAIDDLPAGQPKGWDE